MNKTNMQTTKLKSTTMTDPRVGAKRAGRRTAHRPFDLIWKNALLATSLGATLIGWGWLAKTDTAAAQTPAVTTQSPTQTLETQLASPSNRLWQPQEPVAQPEIGSDTTASAAPNIMNDTQFQQPQRLFRRPVTRTRHS